MFEEGMVIHIPVRLADALGSSGLRIDRQDSLAVMAWLIASRSRGEKFHPMSYDFIERFLRRPSIKERKQTLFEWRIIECDGKYSSRKPNSKSFGYRISDVAAASGVVPYVVQSARYLEKLSEKPQNTSEVTTDVHRWLWDCLNRTEMDAAAARCIADGLPPAKRLHAHVSIDWFMQGRLWFKPDAYGRIHTNVTSLKRELRPTLHFGDGEPLVELDIRCSQPTLLYGMLPKQLRSADDALEYLALCRSGELYTALAVGMTRTEAKKAFFHYLYSWQESEAVRQVRKHSDESKQRQRIARDAITRIMETCFPTLSNFVLRRKRAVGHKAFSHQMQRLESELLIDGVCGRVMRQKPETPILTIHDSLLTVNAEQSTIEESLDRTLNDAGIQATITTTIHSRSTATKPHAAPTPI